METGGAKAEKVLLYMASHPHTRFYFYFISTLSVMLGLSQFHRYFLYPLMSHNCNSHFLNPLQTVVYTLAFVTVACPTLKLSSCPYTGGKPLTSL